MRRKKVTAVNACYGNECGGIGSYPLDALPTAAEPNSVRALDSADLNGAFLRLWSLLEHLTDSTHEPYKVATRRAAFMFADRERSQLVLSNLTNYRNRFVHVGSETGDIESLVFQLKTLRDRSAQKLAAGPARR